MTATPAPVEAWAAAACTSTGMARGSAFLRHGNVGAIEGFWRFPVNGVRCAWLGVAGVAGVSSRNRDRRDLDGAPSRSLTRVRAGVRESAEQDAAQNQKVLRRIPGDFDLPVLAVTSADRLGGSRAGAILGESGKPGGAGTVGLRLEGFVRLASAVQSGPRRTAGGILALDKE
jgi:hypothetical protein